MSASLVGSEMCIRDRVSPCARRRPRRHGWRAHSLRQCPASSRPRIRCPVSYTHLTLPTICSV
eukprot:4507354-Alexandrium_andersonii.AAC.1